MTSQVSVFVDPGVGGGYGIGQWDEGVSTWAAQTRTWDGPWRYEGAAVELGPRATSLLVRRGRRDETEAFGFGSSRLILKNLDGYFDPDGTFPLRLRQPVDIYSQVGGWGYGTWNDAVGDWTEQVGFWVGPQVFAGFVEDVDLRYEPGGIGEVDLACVDGLSILSNQSVQELVVPQEDSGARIRRILAAPGVDYPGLTSVDDGLSPLGAGTATANVTEYLRAAELSEQGRLFVDRNGTLTFRNRRQTFGTPYIFADDGSGTYYSTVERFSGARALFNRVIGRTPDGTSYLANNLRSQEEFNVRTRDLGTLLSNSATTVIGLVSWLATIYARPETRAYALSVIVDRLSSTEQYELLTLDLTSPADVTFSPPGRTAFTSPSLVQGIEHRITVGSAWVSSFFFERRFEDEFFTLDDTSLGRLDLNELTF